MPPATRTATNLAIALGQPCPGGSYPTAALAHYLETGVGNYTGAF